MTMSNWVSCLVNVVVLFCFASTGNFCLASTGGSSGGSGLPELTTTKPSLMKLALKPFAPVGKAMNTLKTLVVKTKASTTPTPLPDYIIAFVVIRIQYVNEDNENVQKFLDCGGTIVTEKEVLTDAGCFQDREKKSITYNSDILKLRDVKLLVRENTIGRQLERDISKVEVYRNLKSQNTNEQFNIARVTVTENVHVKPLQVCDPGIIENVINRQLFIVDWRKCNVMNWVDIQVEVTNKSNCKREHTRYGGPDTYCAFPTKPNKQTVHKTWLTKLLPKSLTNTLRKEQDRSGKICTNRGGPVLWKGPNEECLVGVINDGDNLDQNIIFTSLNEYGRSKIHRFSQIYPSRSSREG